MYLSYVRLHSVSYGMGKEAGYWVPVHGIFRDFSRGGGRSQFKPQKYEGD